MILSSAKQRTMVALGIIIMGRSLEAVTGRAKRHSLSCSVRGRLVSQHRVSGFVSDVDSTALVSLCMYEGEVEVQTVDGARFVSDH